MFRIVLMLLALLVTGYPAFGQLPDPSQPLLTTELLRRIDPLVPPDPRDDLPLRPAGKRADALTEADVLKLLPVAYRLAPTPADSGNNWIIICAEKTEFVFEFTDGKLSSHSATFHPTAKSRNLTLERFRELKDGMTKQEVETLFGEELQRGRDWWKVPAQNPTPQVERWRDARGRELQIGIARGRVKGALLKSHKDK